MGDDAIRIEYGDGFVEFDVTMTRDCPRAPTERYHNLLMPGSCCFGGSTSIILDSEFQAGKQYRNASTDGGPDNNRMSFGC